MKIDLTKYTIDELVKLRDQINGLIYNHSDGYLYICSVRQFGSVWEERPSSLHSLKELCDEYRGDNGIVDVYTNNPNLKFPEMEFYNYGDVMYIKSEYDYREWVKYNKSQKLGTPLYYFSQQHGLPTNDLESKYQEPHPLVFQPKCIYLWTVALN